MIKQILSTSIIAASIAVSTQALAEAPSYTYVEAGFTSRADLAGYRIGGSIELGANIFANLNYEVRDQGLVGTDINNNNISADFEETKANAGIGYIFSESDSSNAYVVLSFEDSEVELDESNGSFISIDESGYGIAIGARNNITDIFQVGAEAKYIEIGDNIDGVELSSYVQFDITERAAVRASVEFSDINSAFTTDFTETGFALELHWAF